MIKSEQRQFTTWVLTEEGRQVAREGSHEVHVFLAVHPVDGTPQSEVMVRGTHHTSGCPPEVGWREANQLVATGPSELPIAVVAKRTGSPYAWRVSFPIT